MIGSLGEVAAAAGGRLVGASGECPVPGVSTDTRELAPGELFVALTGERFDGHRFAADALRLGACACLVEREGAVAGGPGIVVTDSARALLAIAAFHRARHPVPAVAVTGSSGKTTTKEMAGAVLSVVGKPCVAPASFNNLIGVSRTLLALRDDHDALVAELGMNAPGEIGPLSRAVSPCVAVVTNVGRAHIGRLGSREAILNAKAEILEGLAESGTLCVNADDAGAMWIGGMWPGSVCTFGTGEGADVRGLGVRVEPDGVSFSLSGGRVMVPLPGLHNVHNALAAAAACRALGVDDDAIVRGLGAVGPVPMRMERRSLGGFELILDCYNANPESVCAAVEALRIMPSAGRRVLVIGEMLELGDEAERAWGDVAGCIAAGGVDVVLAVGGAAVLAERLKSRCPPDVVVESVQDVEIVGRKLLPLLGPGDTILIKASRRVALERVVDTLTENLSNSSQAEVEG